MAREPYCDLADVRRHLAFLPASSSPSGPLTPLPATYRPNSTQVDEHCRQASNEIDAVLALVDYSVPIPTTASLSYQMVRGWAAIGAAQMSAQAMPQGADSKHAAALGERFTAILTSIRDRDIVLPDAGKEARSRARSFAAPADSAGASPMFTRELIDDR